MGKTPAFEVVKGEQRTFIRRELSQQGFDFVGRATTGGVASRIDCLRRCRRIVFRGSFDRPSLAHHLATEMISPRIRRDSQQPMDEWLIAAPLGKAADHPEKGVLHEII